MLAVGAEQEEALACGGQGGEGTGKPPRFDPALPARGALAVSSAVAIAAALADAGVG